MATDNFVTPVKSLVQSLCEPAIFEVEFSNELAFANVMFPTLLPILPSIVKMINLFQRRN